MQNKTLEEMSLIELFNLCVSLRVDSKIEEKVNEIIESVGDNNGEISQS